MKPTLPLLVAASVSMLIAACSSGSSASDQRGDGATDSSVMAEVMAVPVDATLPPDTAWPRLDGELDRIDAPALDVALDAAALDGARGAPDFPSSGDGAALGGDSGTGEVSAPGLDGATSTGLVITPSSDDLGRVVVGQMGPPTTFTVTNPGPIESGALTVSTSRPELVIATDTCTGQSLGRGMTCTIAIALKPTSMGALTATLAVVGPKLSVVKALMGTGVDGGHTTLNPAALDFGDVAVGTTSPGQTVSLTNYGGAPSAALSLRTSGPSDAFVVSANTCTGQLAPGVRCTFTVSFAPTSPGPATAAITVTDGQVSGTVTLSGNGV